MNMDIKHFGLSKKTNITLAYILTTVWLAVTAVEKISNEKAKLVVVAVAMVLIFWSHLRGRQLQYNLDLMEMESKKCDT